MRLSGRKYLFDVVMQAPSGSRNAFRGAVGPNSRARTGGRATRFHFRETGRCRPWRDTGQDRTRGPHGAIVKAPDTAELAEAIDRLTAEGIPVVTYATDVPRSSRIGYVGIDNRDAGATAAYLSTNGSATNLTAVLVTRAATPSTARRSAKWVSAPKFAGLSAAAGRPVVEINESEGLDDTIESWCSTPSMRIRRSVRCTRSAAATSRHCVLRQKGRRCRVFIAHDLDEDNSALLRARKVSAVLHHDLRADANLAGGRSFRLGWTSG